MEHKITQFSVLTDPARPMPSIAVLQCREPAPLDAAPVDYLVAQRGADAAEEMICRVLEDIALRLDAVQQAMAAQGFTSLSKQAIRIDHVAAQIGLTDVSLAAAGVAKTALQEDGVAICATVARLERCFDMAVTEIWRFRDRLPS